MSTDSGFGEAVIISLARGNHQGYSSLVYCLNVSCQKEQQPRCNGEPFLLYHIDRDYRLSLYAWPNQKLREASYSLELGSIISYRRQDQTFIANTGKKMVSTLCIQSTPNITLT